MHTFALYSYAFLTRLKLTIYLDGDPATWRSHHLQ